MFRRWAGWSVCHYCQQPVRLIARERLLERHRDPTEPLLLCNGSYAMPTGSVALTSEQANTQAALERRRTRGISDTPAAQTDPDLY